MNNTKYSNPEWSGYNLAELKQRIAANAQQIDIQKSEIVQQVDRLQSFRNNARTISRKLLTALSYTDYIVLAAGLFRKVRAIIRLFRR